jgi:hypothetical protein
MQEQQSVVEKSHAIRLAGQPRRQPRQHPGLATCPGRWLGQAMRRDIVDGLAERLQHARRTRMRGVERTQQVGQLRQRDGRMIDDARLEEPVDRGRRPALEHIDIDACVQQQFSPCQGRLVGDERKIGIGATRQRRPAPLGLYAPEGFPAVIAQA